MFEFEIPAATWVVFENNGFFKENVQSVFKRFYTEWLPFSGYEYAELPDIEVYPVCEEKSILNIRSMPFAKPYCAMRQSTHTAI